MKRKILLKRAGALLAVFALLLTSCNKTKETSGAKVTSSTTTTEVASSTTSEATETSATAENSAVSEDAGEGIVPHRDIQIPSTVYVSKEESDAFLEELKKLPGVVDVKHERRHKNGQYVVFYEMPLDHKDPSKGTFTQRMYVYYKGKDAPNLFYCGGYNLYFGVDSNSIYDVDTGMDEEECSFSAMYNCNFIEPEFRLYEPGLEEMNYKNVEYWEYLTDEDASEDFHFMIEGLKTLLSGKWAFEGHSKGGSFTAYQLGRHPEDADLFVVEAGLNNSPRNLPGMYEFTYTTAGDDRYGKKTAKKYRDMILELQVELIKHKKGVIKHYINSWMDDDSTKVIFSSDMTEDIIYECGVLDLMYCWQYCIEEFFTRVEEVLSMKEATTSGDNWEYESELGMLMNSYYNEMQYAVTLENINRSTVVFHKSLYGFMFQNYREDGNFLYDFSYLREALEKDGSGAKLTITEAMEETLFERRIYEGHKEKISYDPSVYETRKRGVENTEKPVIIVNGTTDVCHIAGLMECDNPNVHIFNVIGACHDEVSCAYLFTDEKVPYQPLTQEQRDEYNGVVKKALG